MSENSERYSKEQALEEANKIQEILRLGRANNYTTAENSAEIQLRYEARQRELGEQAPENIRQLFAKERVLLRTEDFALAFPREAERYFLPYGDGTFEFGPVNEGQISDLFVEAVPDEQFQAYIHAKTAGDEEMANKILRDIFDAKPLTGKRVLEIGSGVFANASRLAAALGAEVVSVDALPLEEKIHHRGFGENEDYQRFVQEYRTKHRHIQGDLNNRSTVQLVTEHGPYDFVTGGIITPQTPDVSSKFVNDKSFWDSILSSISADGKVILRDFHTDDERLKHIPQDWNVGSGEVVYYSK